MKQIKHKVKKNVEAFQKHKAHVKKKMKNYVHGKIVKHHKKLHSSFHAVTNLVVHLEYAGLFVVSILGIMGLSSFASFGAGLQDNPYLIYPFEKIPTVECRTMFYGDITTEDDCLIDFPIIEEANYQKYWTDELYRSIYTVQWGAPYEGDSWEQEVGAHPGTDIAASRGTPLFAIGKGKVEFAGEKPGWGNVVIQSMQYKGVIYEVIYAHMDEIHVKGGQPILQGEKIGTVGNSGMTFGALGGYHLHWQINVGDTYSYLGCPAEDLGKGHVYITNNGKCRDALKKNTVDPIVLVEQSRQGLRTVVSIPDPDTTPIQVVVSEDTAKDTTSTFTPVDVHAAATPDIDTDDDLVVDQSQVAVAGQLDVKNIDTSSNVQLFDWEVFPKHQLNYAAQEFLKRHTVSVTYKKQSATETLLTLSVVDTKTQKPYHGIMPVSFEFISTGKGVELQREVITLITQGTVENVVTHPIASDASIGLFANLWKWGNVEL